MADKKIKQKKRQSLLWGLADRLTAVIYSFFIHGRLGSFLSSRDTYSRESFFASAYEEKRFAYENSRKNQHTAKAKQGFSSNVIEKLGGFWAALRLNVYGTFLAFYGLSACIAHLIPLFINGISAIDEMTLIYSAIILICAIPLLFSQKSAIEAISGSVFLGRFVLNILCVPEEKLKVKKQYGGTGFIFVSSVLGMVLGGLSIFTHPLLIPVLIMGFLVMMAIFAFPEIGTITTLALIPFMKYIPEYEKVLLVIVIVTGMSYLFKVVRRRRTFSFTFEIVIIILFCGFVLVGGFSPHGGIQTFFESLSVVILILGGFLITYNTINSKELLSSCLKTLTVSFLMLCMVGIWESVYNGISKRIIDSISPSISSLNEDNILYILDDGVVFGMFAVFVFPLLFAYLTNRKNVKSTVAICLCGMVLTSAAWMCSHYEIIIALIIEFVIFWFIFSHKTMTAVIFAVIPVGIAAMVYPYVLSFFGLPDISVILMKYVPAGIENTDSSLCVMKDVLKMISDGNMFGIGAGEQAFKLAFSPYATAASLGAEHPMSFVLQLLCWSGIFGLAAFAVFLILLVKRSLGFFITAERGELRSKALAIFCGLVAALLLGNVYSIWADIRVMYLFCVFAGLLLGHIRLAYAEDDIRMTEYMNLSSEADVKVVFYDLQ